MSKKGAVPDAWDDDWENLADKQDSFPQREEPPAEVKSSKAERKAKHQELNKQLWDSAENTDSLLFLETKSNVPLKSTFKPNVTVLSRKPPPKVLSRNEAASGLAGLKLDDDEDSEDEARKKRSESVAEQRARTQREREEKQRKYNEVREKLFGTSASTTEESQNRVSPPNRQSRGKGKGRGGRDSQPSSSNDPSPARAGQKKQLYDPSYSIKPNSVYIQRKENPESRPGSGSGTPNNELQPIRGPRGPTSSGRGGFGFAARGDRTGATT